MLSTRADSFSSDDNYDDEILRLAWDPELNREKNKTSRIILIIQDFSISERKVSRLCQLSLKILQTLEKIELNLRNWAFLSLDMNSANHFDATNTEEIKIFNTNVSVRIISSCQDLTVKLNKVSADLDFITKALRSLTPIEYISDSGTLLTSFTLRSIRLKDELRRKITIAYLKATLITIGSDLELMLSDAMDEQQATVTTYKQFVVSLLDQLNQAVEEENEEDINECFAVISDMEQMFEVFKLETAQKASKDLALETYILTEDQMDSSSETAHSIYGSELNINDDLTWPSQGSSPLYLRPIVRSITKPGLLEYGPDHRRKSLVSSYASTSMLQKSTITEELPYLMSAFNLAKTLEEDMHHFKEDEDEYEKPRPATSPITQRPSTTGLTHFLDHSGILPKTSLYSNSQILTQPMLSPSSYLYANNSLLSKLGIKPQVITTNITSHLSESSSIFSDTKLLIASSSSSENKSDTDKDEKLNSNKPIPLTTENLATHNLTALSSVNIDLGADYVE